MKEGCCRFDLDQHQDRWLRLDIPTMYPRWKYVLVNLSKTCVNLNIGYKMDLAGWKYIVVNLNKLRPTLGKVNDGECICAAV